MQRKETYAKKPRLKSPGTENCSTGCLTVTAEMRGLRGDYSAAVSVRYEYLVVVQCHDAKAR
jgi:hypothetical protein